MTRIHPDRPDRIFNLPFGVVAYVRWWRTDRYNRPRYLIGFTPAPTRTPGFGAYLHLNNLSLLFTIRKDDPA